MARALDALQIPATSLLDEDRAGLKDVEWISRLPPAPGAILTADEAIRRRAPEFHAVRTSGYALVLVPEATLKKPLSLAAHVCLAWDEIVAFAATAAVSDRLCCADLRLVRQRTNWLDHRPAFLRKRRR